MANPDPEDGDILYDGGFDAWEKRLTAILTKHHLEHHLRTEADVAELGRYEKAKAAAALSLATGLIDASVMRAIPTEVMGSLPRLTEWLRMRTRPFRFLDLPPEIRNRIYGYLIPKIGVSIHILIPSQGTASDVPVAPTGSSAIKQVSRQIREETCGLFYSRSTFSLDATRLPYEPSRIREFLCSWAASMRPHDIKDLRNVNFSCLLKKRTPSGSEQLKTLRLWMYCDPKEGFEMLWDVAASSRTVSKLREHRDRVEEMRKLLNLQGEALVLALTLEKRLWDFGVLRSTLSLDGM